MGLSYKKLMNLATFFFLLEQSGAYALKHLTKPGKKRQESLPLKLFKDEVCGLFADHHRSSIRVARYNGGHDGCIRHTQALDALDTKGCIYDG